MKFQAAIALAGLMLAASPLAAQDEVVRDQSPDARDIATTPLSDLNLEKDAIPGVLEEAVAAPYASEALVNCADLGREIARLDAVLGPDLDLAEGGRGLTVGKVAQSAVASFIPFRSVIREVSGAASHEREFKQAIFAGAVRRGYLKGLGEQRGCAYPARPAFEAIEITDDDIVDGSLGSRDDEDAGN